MSEMETSTVDAPRDSSGQFTGGEEKFGLQGVEVDQGYTHVKTPAEPPADDSPEAVYEDYKRKRGDADGSPVVRELTYADTGEKVEPNLAVTPEQAHAALTQSYSFEQAARELLGIEQTREEIDKARAEKIKGDPNLADHYGLDAKEVEANAAKNQQSPENEPEAPAERSTVDGLDPEVERALKHPQVREAIEQELGKAHHAQQAYTQALSVAQQVAQAGLVDTLPELTQIPLDRWAEAISILHQTDPQRVQRAMAIIERGAQVEAAQSQHQQHQAAEHQQRVETWARDQNSRYDAWAAKEGIKPSDIAPAAQEYLNDLGIDGNSLVRLTQQNPVLRSSEFQRMLTDATRYRMMKSAPAKAIPKPVPHVQRPGVAAPKGAYAAENLQSLRNRLASTGSPEDAFALYQARKRK